MNDFIYRFKRPTVASHLHTVLSRFIKKSLILILVRVGLGQYDPLGGYVKLTRWGTLCVCVCVRACVRALAKSVLLRWADSVTTRLFR